MWISELFDFGPWHPDRFHDLKLVGVTSGLGLQLALGSFASCGTLRGGGNFWLVFFLSEVFKVVSEQLDFADNLVSSSLRLQIWGAYNE